MFKKDSLIPPNHSINNLNIKRNSNNNKNINKPNIKHNQKNNIKNHIIKSNTKSPITKSKTKNIIKISNKKKKIQNINTNKKNPEDKDKTDLNSIGTKNKSLFKPKYHKHLKKFFPNLTDRNSRMRSLNLENLKTTFINKEKNLSINKVSSLKVTMTAKRADSVLYQNMDLN